MPRSIRRGTGADVEEDGEGLVPGERAVGVEQRGESCSKEEEEGERLTSRERGPPRSSL